MKCIFIGYLWVKGYKLQISSKHRHTHNRDVIFEEKSCDDEHKGFLLVEKVQHIAIPYS
jgi:hypothetical protein